MRTLVILFGFCICCLLSACAKQTDLTPKLWQVHTGGVFNSVVDGNLIVGYLSAINDQVVAVDLTTHEVIWRSAEGSGGTNFALGLAVNQDAVFVYLGGKGLYVYSRAGELLKQLVPPELMGDDKNGRASASFVLLGSMLLMPLDTQLYAYDVSKPSEPVLLWQRTFSEPIFALTADTEGVYIGGVAANPGNGLIKLSLSDGQELWEGQLALFDQNRPLTMALAVTGEQVIAYSLDTNGSLQTFDRKTGERLWATQLDTCSDGAGFLDDFEIGNGKIFVSPAAGSCFFAVDLATGKEAWTVETGEVGPDGAISIGGKPLYHNGVVYTSVERLWALDAETGKALSFAKEPAYNTTGTILHYADGQVLVWGDDLTAYKPVR